MSRRVPDLAAAFLRSAGPGRNPARGGGSRRGGEARWASGVRPRWLDYVFALTCVALAIALRKLLPIEPGVGLYPLPLSAVIVSAWRGGRGPGLLATGASAGAIAYWFLPPLYSVGMVQVSGIGFVIFVAVAILATEFSMARRRAEDALRRSEAYLAEAQRLSHTGSWAWDPRSGEIRYLSDECRRLLGLGAGRELPARSQVAEKIHPEDLESVRQQIATALRERKDFEVGFRLVRGDPGVRQIFAVGHPVIDVSGGAGDWVGTLVDVTERSRAEAERERLRQVQADLERTNRISTLGELSATLAHEIRQPIAAALTNARTSLRWLDRRPPDLAEARAAVGRSVDDMTRAAEIITRLRSLFQKATPRQEWTDLNIAVSEVAAMLRGEARRHGVVVQLELAYGLPAVRADRIQLQQVLMNLMMNAIEAMRDQAQERTLALRTSPCDGDVQVSVSDTGSGLPEQHAGQVFEAFFTTKPEGTGMGLAISRSIIESHGGRLWAEGREGRGTCFHFRLPAAAEVGR